MPMILPGKELLYLRSTGTQYIDTGYYPEDRTTVVCRAILPNLSNTNWLFGARQSSSVKLFTFAWSTTNQFAAGFENVQIKFDKSYNTGEELTIHMGNDQSGDMGDYCELITEHGNADGYKTYYRIYDSHKTGEDFYWAALADFEDESNILEMLVAYRTFDNEEIGGAYLTALNPGLYLIFPALSEGEKAAVAELDVLILSLTWESEEDVNSISTAEKILLHQIFGPVIAMAILKE